MPTINFRVDFFRPSTGAFLVVKAAMRRLDRNVAVAIADVGVYDDYNRLTTTGGGCSRRAIGLSR